MKWKVLCFVREVAKKFPMAVSSGGNYTHLENFQPKKKDSYFYFI